MKKTIIILSLLLAFSTTNAQSDATWEETIAFIDKYKQHIIDGFNGFVPENHLSDGEITVVKFIISESEIEIHYTITYDSGNTRHCGKGVCRISNNSYKTIIPLKYLKKIGSSLYLTRPVEYWKSQGCYYSDYCSDRCVDKLNYKDKVYTTSTFQLLVIYDDEMRERMDKAFKHLAKLATEKREAERKASGDKF